MTTKVTEKQTLEREEHPMEKLLRMDRIPHIWCPTCGLGTTVTALAAALEQLKLDLNNVAVVS
jgi:2-oxoglutarate ferredoxin oxidoreductase subunit beta